MAPYYLSYEGFDFSLNSFIVFLAYVARTKNFTTEAQRTQREHGGFYLCLSVTLLKKGEFLTQRRKDTKVF